MHSIHSGRSPVYMADMVEPTSARSTRRLRSTDSGLYDVPRLQTKFGKRAFSFSGPSAWNALPADIRDEICTATFQKKLKTFYFSLAFDCIWHRFYVTFVMHLRSYSSGGTTKFLTWTWTWLTCRTTRRLWVPATRSATDMSPSISTAKSFVYSWSLSDRQHVNAVISANVAPI